jgi:hypothetical protein
MLSGVRTLLPRVGVSSVFFARRPERDLTFFTATSLDHPCSEAQPRVPRWHSIGCALCRYVRRAPEFPLFCVTWRALLVLWGFLLCRWLRTWRRGASARSVINLRIRGLLIRWALSRQSGI